VQTLESAAGCNLKVSLAQRHNATDRLYCASEGDRQFQTGRSSAAPECSNHTDLHLTLTDLLYGSDLPERPSTTSMRLVCIQTVTLVPQVTLQRASCREDAVAPHTGRGHPYEVRGHSLNPRL
jgi:hypothetical protein